MEQSETYASLKQLREHTHGLLERGCPSRLIPVGAHLKTSAGRCMVDEMRSWRDRRRSRGLEGWKSTSSPREAVVMRSIFKPGRRTGGDLAGRATSSPTAATSPHRSSLTQKLSLILLNGDDQAAAQGVPPRPTLLGVLTWQPIRLVGDGTPWLARELKIAQLLIPGVETEYAQAVAVGGVISVIRGRFARLLCGIAPDKSGQGHWVSRCPAGFDLGSPIAREQPNPRVRGT